MLFWVLGSRFWVHRSGLLNTDLPTFEPLNP
jgi:hypothetical protein